MLHRKYPHLWRLHHLRYRSHARTPRSLAIPDVLYGSFICNTCLIQNNQSSLFTKSLLQSFLFTRNLFFQKHFHKITPKSPIDERVIFLYKKDYLEQLNHEVIHTISIT